LQTAPELAEDLAFSLKEPDPFVLGQILEYLPEVRDKERFAALCDRAVRAELSEW
jgi:hypothetical protein